ncbi:MAG: hypothetical protein ABJA71_08120 [Ginsengibacter sp.]
MKKTIEKVSEETLRIENIFTSAAKGEYFSYSQLEKITNVVMDEKGKTYMRSALRRLKIPYETLKGEGITTVSAKNATKILVHKVIKIDNSIKRAERTTKQVKDKVYDELTEPEQKNIIFLSSLFGTIRSYSNNAKKIFYVQPLKVGIGVNG